jgi:hypothetical protein
MYANTAFCGESRLGNFCLLGQLHILASFFENYRIWGATFSHYVKSNILILYVALNSSAA